MNVLLIDFEATSVDPKTARPLEIGALIVDEYFQDNQQGGMSQLIWESGYPALTPEVERVTNISQKMLNEQSINPTSAFGDLGYIANETKPTYAIAYNTAYDRELFRTEVLRLGMEDNPGLQWLMKIPWLCAMSDVESNYAFKSWRLMHVALEYGVTVNPKNLHRAIADVELMRKMLEASMVTPLQMYDFQLEPWIFVRAFTTEPWKDGGESNNLAKALGFRWEQPTGSDRKFPKMWVKRIKQKHLENLMASPLKIARIE